MFLLWNEHGKNLEDKISSMIKKIKNHQCKLHNVQRYKKNLGSKKLTSKTEMVPITSNSYK